MLECKSELSRILEPFERGNSPKLFQNGYHNITEADMLFVHRGYAHKTQCSVGMQFLMWKNAKRRLVGTDREGWASLVWASQTLSIISTWVHCYMCKLYTKTGRHKMCVHKRCTRVTKCRVTGKDVLVKGSLLYPTGIYCYRKCVLDKDTISQEGMKCVYV